MMLYGGIPFGFDPLLPVVGFFGTLFFALVLYRLVFGWRR